MKEPEETCIYEGYLWTTIIALGKLYTAADIEKAKMSVSFEREIA